MSCPQKRGQNGPSVKQCKSIEQLIECVSRFLMANQHN